MLLSRQSFVQFGALFQVPQQIHHLKNNYDRCLYISLVLLSLIICHSYTGFLVGSLSSEQQSMDLKSLKDIIKSGFKVLISLGFKVGSEYKFNYNFNFEVQFIL